MHKIFQELRRRNVFRIAGLYAVIGWLLMQLAVVLETTLLLPSWFDTFITVVVILGFPLALIGAWAFEMTPDGIKLTRAVDPAESVSRQTGRRLDFILAGAAILLVIVIIGDRVIPSAPVPGERAVPGMETAEASIAVLPFADMSADGDQVYFADGISEELLNVLAQVPGFAVAGRTSSFAFKGKNEDLREIGNILSVEHILEGSVRKAGNRVRVTAQLIRVDNGFHVWSETYDRDLDDIFAVQDEIANAILVELKPQLIGEAAPVLAAARTDISAYDLYLLAQQKAAPGIMADYEEAAEALEKALEIDPDYVPALAWRGYYELMLSDGDGAAGDVPIETALENAGEWTARALALDPTSADALFARAGWISMSLDADQRKQAGRYYELALAEKPNFPLARNDYAYWLWRNDNSEEALRQLELALEHDPAQNDANTNLVAAYVQQGEFEQAAALLDRWQSISPENTSAYIFRGGIEIRKGRLADGFRYLEKALALAPGDPRVRREYYSVLNALGEFGHVEEEFEGDLTIFSLVRQGRGEEATALAKAAVEARPDYPYAQRDYIITLYYTRQWDELIAHYDASWGDIETFGDAFFVPPYWVYVEPMDEAGHRDGEAMAKADREAYAARVESGVQGAEMTSGAADLAILDGRYDEALDLLEQAFGEGRRSMGVFDNPIYEPLRGKPRFEAIRQRTEDAVNEEREKLGLEPIDMPVPYTEHGY